MPGKSNAFAISKKLGLDDEIIDMANSFIGTRDRSFEDIISELDKARIELEEKNEAASKAMVEAQVLRDKLEAKNERLDAAKEKVLRRANEEAREILQKAKDYTDETIRKVNKLGAAGMSVKELEAERAGLREKLGSADEKLAIKPAKPKKNRDDSRSIEEVKVGDTVFVRTMNLKGKVCTVPNPKGDLFVQLGAMRTQVNIKDLEYAEAEPEAAAPKNTGAGKIAVSKSMSVGLECNLVGMRVDEALPVLDKYLDDAYLAHLPQVSVIHGRGTGALRDAVHRHLKNLKYVKSFRLGEFGEGDRGVTIVTFKE